MNVHNTKLPWQRPDTIADAFAAAAHHLCLHGLIPICYVEGYLTPIDFDQIPFWKRNIPEGGKTCVFKKRINRKHDPPVKKDVGSKTQAVCSLKQKNNKKRRINIVPVQNRTRSALVPVPILPRPTKECVYVHKRCVHSVRKCRHCAVYPLHDGEGTLVTHFVEHRDQRNRSIKCTVGSQGISNFHFQPEGGDTFDVPSSVDIDPRLKVLHTNASLSDDESDLEHYTCTYGEQFKKVEEELAEKVPRPIVGRAMKIIEQITLLITGIQLDCTLEAVVLRCVTFMSAITDDGIVGTLSNMLSSVVSRAKIPKSLDGKTVGEAFASEKRASDNRPEDGNGSSTTLQIWEALNQKIFTKHLSMILGTVFAFSTCKIRKINFSHPIYTKVMEAASCEEIDAFDFIDHAIKLYNWVSTVGIACIEQQSLSPMLYNSGTLSLCHEKLYYWQNKYTDMRRAPSTKMEERQQMFIEVKMVKDSLASFVKLQRDKFTTLQASSLFNQVNKLYNDVHAFVKRVDQVKVAFGVHLHGVPKVGKSTISTDLHKIFCLARGVTYREEDNAQLNLLAPYQDELENSTQTITLNETLPIKEKYAGSAEQAYCTSLALVDPVPFHPNRSNLEDKANITCQHISVVSTGNTAQPFLHLVKTPGAWERRYVSVHMRVQRDYDDGYGRVDGSKTDGSDNYHLFDVYEIVYIGDVKKIVYFRVNERESRDLKTPEFLDLMRDLATKHYMNQDVLEANRKAQDNAPCTKCMRLDKYCQCDGKTVDQKTISVERVVSSAFTTTGPFCSATSRLGDNGSPCQRDENGVCCRCGESDSRHQNVPETLTQMVSKAAWYAVSPYISSFFNMQWMLSMDCAVADLSTEAFMEEIAEIPQDMAMNAMSLVPQDWLNKEVEVGFDLFTNQPIKERRDTFLGKMKKRFIYLTAAHRQVFVPARFMIKRAFFWAILMFLVTLASQSVVMYYWPSLWEYEMPTMLSRERTSLEMVPIFPQWSSEVMERREQFAEIGVYVDHYVDWKKYYSGLYFTQKQLGRLAFPKFVTRQQEIMLLTKHKRDWWNFPTVIGISSGILLLIKMILRRKFGVEERYRAMMKAAEHDPAKNERLVQKIKTHSSEYHDYYCAAIGIVGAIGAGLLIWNHNRSEGITRSGAEGDLWNSFSLFHREKPEPTQDPGTYSTQGVSRVAKNCTFITATFTLSGKEMTRDICGVYMEPGILQLPLHFFRVNEFTQSKMIDEMDLLLDCSGVKHKVRVYPKSLEIIKGKDCVLLFVPRAPCIAASLVDMLPTKTGGDCHKAHIIVPKKTGVESEVVNAKYVDEIRYGDVSVGRGLEYGSNITRAGVCGSPLMSDARPQTLLGFHICGRPNDLFSSLKHARIGCSQEILFEDYQDAKRRLMCHPGVMNCPEMREIPRFRYGHDFIPGEGPHPKTEVFQEGKLHSHPCFQVLGHDLKLPRYRSKVRKSLISDTVDEVCGVPNQWKRPDMSQPWEHHNKALTHVANGAWEVPPDALQWAYDDLFNDFMQRLPTYTKEMPHLCQVLSDDEMINGVKGAMYMNQVPMKTSVGPPFSGAKNQSDLFVEVEPGSRGEKRYGLSETARRAFDDLTSCLESGQKYGVWVKSCLKDEVVQEDSEKVRIFYIMEAMFGLLVRKYYLPIAEFISRNPTLCECAVGINCAGTEWEKLMSFVEELATDDKLTDWDYSKYDLKRSPDVMVASLNLMRRIAEYMGYSKKDLYVMEMAAHELRCPLINWNGTIILMYLWTSGNNMTVYGNSLENSLHQRISLYLNWKKTYGDVSKIGRFKDHEHICTYGDDGTSGSSLDSRKVCNFSAKFSYFDHIGMKITDAKKSDNPLDETPKEDTDFLKRQSSYLPELGIRVGALDKNSIWKMSHMHVGTGELEDLAVASIQSMLVEAFLHGEDFYEELRWNMSTVAKRHTIWTEHLDWTYHDRVEQWKEKYAPALSGIKTQDE